MYSLAPDPTTGDEVVVYRKFGGCYKIGIYTKNKMKIVTKIYPKFRKD